MIQGANQASEIFPLESHILRNTQILRIEHSHTYQPFLHVMTFTPLDLCNQARE